MLSRIFIAAGLAAALAVAGALAFLRTDFVANNLCGYAVATIEEATRAQVKVARCSVDPAGGAVTIEGLEVGDPDGRLQLSVARVFVQVVVRPLMQRVRLERLEIDHPRLRLALDRDAGPQAPRSSRCLPDLLDRFELGRVQIRKASVAVTAPGARVEVPRLGLTIKGRDDLLSVVLSTSAASVALPGRALALLSSHTEAEVDLRGNGKVELREADLIGEDGLSVFATGKLADLCAPRIEASVNLKADDLAAATAHLIPGVLKKVSGGLSLDTTVSAGGGELQAKGELRVRALALEGFLPGDASVRFDLTPARLKLDHLELPMLRGAITGGAEIGLSGSLPISVELGLREMELAELLRKLGQPHSLVVLRASGKAAARGQLSPFQLAGSAALDLAELAVLDRPFEQRARATKMFEMPAGRLTAAVAVDPDKVVVRQIDLGTGRSRIQGEATFFTDLRRGMQLLAHGESVELADFREHLGPLPAKGAVSFAARVQGPYEALTIEGPASGRDFRLLDLALGDVSTQVGFQLSSMSLAFDQISGRKGRSTYAGRVALALGPADTPLDAHLELPDATLHDLVELSVGLVPTLAPLRDAKDVDGHLSAVLDVKGPAAAPDGTAAVWLDEVQLWGQTFDKGAARLSLHGKEPRLQLEELSLEHGDDAVFRLAGRFGPAWQLDMRGGTESFTLADLDPGKPARLSGPFDGKVRIEGTADHPKVLATVRFPEGRAGKASMGEGDLSLQIDGERMWWRGTVGTHELHGEATLAGSFPYTCAASLHVPDLRQVLDVFAPELDVQSGEVSAVLELSGSLPAWRDSEGSVTMSRLKVVRHDMTFENDAPARLTFGRDGVSVRDLSLRAPYTSVHLSGSRTTDGRLDLRLGASVDGRILENLVPDVEHASGTWLVQASVAGTSVSPTVLGNVRVEDGEVRLRGLPVAARELNGSVSFSQDALVIDSMTGKLNNGEARVSGGMEMTRLSPRRIDMSAHVSDVNVRLQDGLGATLDGDLTLYGPPLEPVLGGSLVVSRMKYTEDLDLERSLLDFSRRPPNPRVLTRSPVLVHFDLDVHLARGVRVENNLARTDLKGDLKVTGTSRAVGLLGSINTVHGTAAFRGNEFQIDQGVLTFTDRQRIRPSFDLQASSAVKEYKVRLHAFGTPAEPHLALSSEPALAEADLGFLLTFGFVSQNLQQATFGAADSGLAIGVEALNKVTGFSEEVRRFIPRNAILRDPNIDFASDFSVATNRLEPMARFRSHLLDDRLDLRILEGLTTRRYRGVVSYQLSDALSTRFQLDNEHLATGTDFGVDLHLKWEGE